MKISQLFIGLMSFFLASCIDAPYRGKEISEITSDPNYLSGSWYVKERIINRDGNYERIIQTDPPILGAMPWQISFHSDNSMTVYYHLTDKLVDAYDFSYKYFPELANSIWIYYNGQFYEIWNISLVEKINNRTLRMHITQRNNSEIITTVLLLQSKI